MTFHFSYENSVTYFPQQNRIQLFLVNIYNREKLELLPVYVWHFARWPLESKYQFPNLDGGLIHISISLFIFLNSGPRHSKRYMSLVTRALQISHVACVYVAAAHVRDCMSDPYRQQHYKQSYL